MTTSRWASPRAARGSRSSATSASSASTSQTTDFTVVGIGDMSGDVFGNGMLLSRAHQAGRGVQPPARVPRPRSRSGARASPSDGGCSSCRARRGATTTSALISDGGGVYRAHREVDPALAPGPRGARRSRREELAPAELIQALLRAPGRPALERRHRHLRQGGQRIPRRRRRQGQRRRPRRRRGAPLPGGRRGRQPRLHPARADRVRADGGPAAAGGSTPTRSTTSPASTAPTTRSTSRSCSTRSSPRAS